MVLYFQLFFVDFEESELHVLVILNLRHLVLLVWFELGPDRIFAASIQFLWQMIQAVTEFGVIPLPYGTSDVIAILSSQVSLKHSYMADD